MRISNPVKRRSSAVLAFLTLVLMVPDNAEASEVIGLEGAPYEQLYRKADTETTNQTVFYCIGVEPQWSLVLELDKFSFVEDRANGKINIEMPRVKPQVPPGFVSDYAQIFTTYNRKNHSPITVVVRKNSAGCLGGYIQPAYEFNATFITQNFTRIGCCNAIRY